MLKKAFLENPAIFLFRKLWKYSEGNRHNVVLYFSLAIFARVTNLIEPLLVAFILNEIQIKGVNESNIKYILILLSLFVLIEVVGWIFHGPSRVLERSNAFLARVNYKKSLFDGVMGLSHDWHVDHHSGDTIDKIEKGTQAIYGFGSNSFIIIGAIISLAGSYIALAFFNIHSLYIALITMSLVFFVITKFDATLIPKYRKLNKVENNIAEKIFDTISNITTVIILRVENFVSKAVFQKMIAPFDLNQKTNTKEEFKWFFVGLLGSLMMFLVLGSYVLFTISTGATILVGTLYALYGYVNRITGVFSNFAYLYGDIVRKRTAVANAEELSNQFTKKSKRKSINLPNNWKALKIKNLSFSYHGAGEVNLHLEKINMEIKNGDRVALIGESGSGKSTLLKVLRELYSPKSGKIFIDNRELKRGFADISKEIALIPQDPEIFSTTIMENITLGIPHGLSKVKQFTDMARFTDVAENLPNKFKSSIVEKGVNLSGGEKQRLALARGLLASENKTFVLLDEPTSSVDSNNERAIYENIFDKFKGKTIISSIHRLHLLPMFDNIYFFKDGVITASGSFAELLTNSLEFKNLWQKYTESQKTEK